MPGCWSESGLIASRWLQNLQVKTISIGQGREDIHIKASWILYHVLVQCMRETVEPALKPHVSTANQDILFSALCGTQANTRLTSTKRVLTHHDKLSQREKSLSRDLCRYPHRDHRRNRLCRPYSRVQLYTKRGLAPRIRTKDKAPRRAWGLDEYTSPA